MNWEEWVRRNPPPSISDLIARFGRYASVPPEAWAKWDAEMEDWHQRRRDRFRV
jgi:hypothetical protein